MPIINVQGPPPPPPVVSRPLLNGSAALNETSSNVLAQSDSHRQSDSAQTVRTSQPSASRQQLSDNSCRSWTSRDGNRSPNRAISAQTHEHQINPWSPNNTKVKQIESTAVETPDKVDHQTTLKARCYDNINDVSPSLRLTMNDVYPPGHEAGALSVTGGDMTGNIGR